MGDTLTVIFDVLRRSSGNLIYWKHDTPSEMLGLNRKKEIFSRTFLFAFQKAFLVPQSFGVSAALNNLSKICLPRDRGSLHWTTAEKADSSAANRTTLRDSGYNSVLPTLVW